MASDSDCQLASGFVSLVVGIGEEAKAVDSQSVDLFDEDGSCSLHPGVVDDIVFWFESVPQTEKLSLVRFVGIDPQLELAENLEFCLSNSCSRCLDKPYSCSIIVLTSSQRP